MSKSHEEKASGRRKTTPHTGFFAYPSEPGYLGDTIERAIELVNKGDCKLYIQSWRSIDRTSLRIISDILDAINKADLFLADISGLNPNVLFETGYAFGKQKHLLLYTQGHSSAERKDDLKDIEILAGLEIAKYQNREDLAASIVRRNPFTRNSQPEMVRLGALLDEQPFTRRGLFLKGASNHDIVISALNTFRRYFPDIRVDDWAEDSSRTLLWYLRSITSSKAVAAIFVPPTWDHSRRNNARFSFLCGVALALGKRVVMVALPGFATPFDYQDILIRPTDADRAQHLIDKALSHNPAEPTEPGLLPPPSGVQ